MTELLDDAAREQIRTDTDTTLFVEAGAGSGKTHALVDRVTTLVLRDEVPLRTIAAVTFTEKAGAELRDRLRVEFEKARKGPHRALADEALDDLDSASIGTLHSFAQQILLAHPIEAGLPPLIDVLDEVGSSVAFEERWSELQQQLLDDDAIAEPLLLAMAVGVELKHLRSLARLFGNDWDLIEERVLVDPPELVAMPDLSGLIAAAAKIGAAAENCRADDDRLLPKVQRIRDLGVMLAAATDAETQLAVLHSVRALKVGKIGRKENWPDIARMRGDCSEVVEVAGSLVELLLDACLRHLSHWLAERVLESAERRRADGRLEFHDLLVLARDLLRREPSVRSALQQRYQRLLLDEFQDTDPIQIELAVRIAGGAAADAEDWRDVEVPDGSLFVVGDPKQSIYRFRRANIATYLTAQSLLGETVTLTTNFRTVTPVLTWINTVFSTLITPAEDAQPTYHPLTPHRPSPPPTPTTLPSASANPYGRRPTASTPVGPVPPPPSSPATGDQLSLFGDAETDAEDEPTPSPSDDPPLATVTHIRRHLSVVPTTPPSDAPTGYTAPTVIPAWSPNDNIPAQTASTPPTASPDTQPPTGGPAVTILGADPHEDLPRAQASVLREREAADVATVISQALDEGWTVYDEKTSTWRPAGAGDIAILVPARTSLPFLEDALDRADIPYRAEASSLVYQTAEVRDLLACARALGDPSDQLALVTALRSPLFGCGDDDLFTWKRSGASFTLTAPVPDSLLAHPVGEAMEWLRRTYYASRWLSPSEVLAKIVADRRMLEVAATGPRARDAWRRVRFVVDQARAWSEVEHGGLRSYLAWAAHQGEEASRVAEAVLPETDADAVRVMTIHAAKGLEFPIVILSGMTASPNRQRGVQVLWPPDGGYAVKLKASIQTEDFDLVQPVDEQMDEYERRRLLYVAATRARDHLVVSLHRSGTRRHSSNAELLTSANALDVPHIHRLATPSTSALTADPASASRPEAGVPGEHFSLAPVASAASPDDNNDSPSGQKQALTTRTRRALEVAPPLNRAEWQTRIEQARASSRRKSSHSPSGLEGTGPDVALHEADPGTAKAARDIDLPPWSKGRYGTAIGRAVHGVLQVVDLTTGAGLDAAVAAQCLAEGVVEYADVVRALVRSALSSEIVQRAATRDHWRESYVGIPQPDGTVLEGFIDLLYREDDGTLMIVDYKTDAIPAAALHARIAHYTPQLQAYTTMLPTKSRATLLFLSPTAAHAHQL
ncbi:UvrD/REP helicase [Kribbella flavida DSM 17836]|uniref:DNA 3'-5' helicase n=1 Tax=Kribbella flavida (strain DSM 17836 / JCM 10339 / NBRC 14399) TaxID=479435 RepID=D2PY25_KRIFD|nr:UvrD-helicase domain-containing protein [Kribbella flavida]ADB33631.1 UvrD/REP helicase [Kribbella flavida DSM 17836]